ncbi:type IV pilus modification PilV family protein [Novipirellula sp. SH528]|uniref:type IV pilus modification PilV family protein n=1 Tax=Novipirellula sp. SH528 TaxID=3454466 RepID=UPI003F9EC5F4
MIRMIKNTTRLGVTLVEVIFAIGVILIGLLGLLSILPLAGHRSQDAISMNVGAALGDSVANDVMARGWITESNLVNLDAPTPTTVERTLTGSIESIIPPFCIDPMLAASPPPALANTSYDSDSFPFYNPAHDPLLDPSIATSIDSPGFAGQPRMVRVRLSDAALTGTGTTLTASQRLEAARTIVESVDDLQEYRPKDRSLPATVSGYRATGDATGSSFGKTLASGEFSWIITVDPFPGNESASMSVVILRNRERMTAFQAASSDAARENALSERVALVTNPVGFNGGAGGSVTLLSAGNTLSDLRSGDWIMLSRSTDPTNAFTRAQSAVHRWYRVAAVTGDKGLLTPQSNSPGPPNTLVNLLNGTSILLPDSDTAVDRTTTQVWQKTVVLDGPDWQFSSVIPTGASTNSLTYATLMEDVVSVTERTISISSF